MWDQNRNGNERHSLERRGPIQTTILEDRGVPMYDTSKSYMMKWEKVNFVGVRASRYGYLTKLEEFRATTTYGAFIVL